MRTKNDGGSDETMVYIMKDHNHEKIVEENHDEDIFEDAFEACL